MYAPDNDIETDNRSYKASETMSTMDRHIQQQQGDCELSDFDDYEINNRELRPFPGYAPVVFKCLSQHSWPRYWLLKLLTSPLFEKVSMFIIIVNCITMGMHQPCEGADCSTKKCLILENIDDFIYFFFLIEMCIKIFAMGLIGQSSYLAEGWNRLDCFIVVAG